MYRYYECYEISSEIMKYYYELNKLLFSGRKDTQSYELIIKRIKRLIIEEYNLMNELSKNEIDKSIEMIEKIPLEEKNNAHDRLQRRLMCFQDILENKFLKGSELECNNIPKNMKFSIYDVITSIIKIAALRKVKAKIETLRPSNKQDIHFVIALKKEYNSFVISSLSVLSLFEMLGINSNIEIDKVSKIDIKIIINKASILFFEEKKESGTSTFDTVILSLVKDSINKLSKIVSINNNPIDVYMYLYKLTELEELISYMNKQSLTQLSEYCKSIKHVNSAIEQNIKRLIKEKIDTNQKGDK